MRNIWLEKTLKRRFKTERTVNAGGNLWQI
jgi:hypothetical protein